jgi:murein tripeptide amidase MpaA
MSAIHVTASIPSGSIQVVDARDSAEVLLRLVRDPGPDALAIGQYHFRATGVRGQPVRYRILGVRTEANARLAGRDALEDAWTGTGPHASYDRKTWFRIPGRIDGNDYVFEHTSAHDVCYFARWAPYTIDRELDFIARCQGSERLRIDIAGHSVCGRELDLLTIGTPAPERRACWIIARQHPSETMGGYFIEGLVERLLDPHDALVRRLLERAVFYIVPNMNPDGAWLGHTRANAAGVNLNRAWVAPNPDNSPEVFHVRGLMERTGVDFCMDCHGDEELRCNFLGGPLEIPSRSARLAGLFADFERAWAAASPEYELGHPYPGGAPAEADLSMAWNWIAERFDCLSVLLEQPFKDTSWWQDPVQGWSPERANRFGATLPTALHALVDRLR